MTKEQGEEEESSFIISVIHCYISIVLFICEFQFCVISLSETPKAQFPFRLPFWGIASTELIPHQKPRKLIYGIARYIPNHQLLYPVKKELMNKTVTEEACYSRKEH